MLTMLNFKKKFSISKGLLTNTITVLKPVGATTLSNIVFINIFFRKKYMWRGCLQADKAKEEEYTFSRHSYLSD